MLSLTHAACGDAFAPDRQMSSASRTSSHALGSQYAGYLTARQDHGLGRLRHEAAYYQTVVRRSRLKWLRVVAAGLGVVALAAGAVALFTIDNSAGSLFLLTVGVVLLLAALLGERIELESFELLGARIKVREVVESRLKLADLASASPQDGAGTELREQARALQRLVGLYDLYGYIRHTEPFGRRRTAALDKLASQMQSVGHNIEFDPADVSRWFHEGTDALRVVALNLMIAREECREFTAVLKSVDAARSNFEQFYGLVLADKMLPKLDDIEAWVLGEAIKRVQRKRRFRQDDDLFNLSSYILSQLNGSTHPVSYPATE
jgi:hypothetical protein